MTGHGAKFGRKLEEAVAALWKGDGFNLGRQMYSGVIR